MININTNKQLGIILPNTNKALAEVLKNISPSDLELLSESKDLKSVLTSLLKDSVQNSKSDKLLLELLKNNPTLKKLGNISNTIKELLGSIKLDKNPLPIEKVLKEFLVDIKQLSEPILKEKIINSGVFMESKIKNVKNPQVELKTILETLSKNIQKSEIPIAKELNQAIKIVLSQKVMQEASHEVLTQSPKIKPKILQSLSLDVKNIVNKLQEMIKLVEPNILKDLPTQILKLENLIKAENLQIPKLQTTLETLISLVSQTSNLDTKSVDKVVQLLLNMEKNIPSSKVSQEIVKIADSLKVAVEKADPTLFNSKEVKEVLTKLSSFTTPHKLMPDAQIKEIVSTDLKSILVQASKEIVESSHPNQMELLKQIDKLSLQIDYHQIMSHLTNSTSLYMPFAWNEMEEGSINLKHSDDNKFYCDIELKLKEYGDLRVRLALYDNNQLNIYLYSGHDDFREIMEENIGTLRKLLIDAEINPREVVIFDSDKKSLPKAYKKSYSSEIDIGLDIKI